MYSLRKKFGTVPSGLVQGGAVTQVVTKGVMDPWLTDPKPDVHFFVSQMLRTCNHAVDIVSHEFVGREAYGTESSLLAHKTADLLMDAYLVLVRPGIMAVVDKTYQGHGGSRPWARCRWP